VTAAAAPARLLRSFYLYQATASCVFFWPVFFVYYEQRVGMSAPTILWLQSYFLVVRGLLGMPRRAWRPR
jgi:hypothetical protein